MRFLPCLDVSIILHRKLLRPGRRALQERCLEWCCIESRCRPWVSRPPFTHGLRAGSW
jgi:hypothetical protein